MNEPWLSTFWLRLWPHMSPIPHFPPNHSTAIVCGGFGAAPGRRGLGAVGSCGVVLLCRLPAFVMGVWAIFQIGFVSMSDWG